MLDAQAVEWQQQVAGGADYHHPPARMPTYPPKYDTIAGLHGVHFPSDPIPVKRGVVYRITVDLKGPEGPKIWAKGYAPFESTAFSAQDREIYRNYLSCKGEAADAGNGYKRYTRTFLPNPFYCLFDVEDLAGAGDGSKATAMLRRRMAARDFALMPEDKQKQRLAKIGFVARYDMVMPELVATVRDRLLCANAVYGKVERGEGGLRLCLRLMSVRIKQNVPLANQEYAFASDAGLAKACDEFVALCERRLPFVQYVRVIPYPYWPPGTYRFDNVTLTEEGETLW